MKSYKYRGWIHLSAAIVGILVAIAGLFLPQKLGLYSLFIISIPQFILFAGQRKLTEQQWKAQQNDKDERYRLVSLKSGAITAAILEGQTGIVLIWATLRDADNFTVISLSVIFMVGAIAFCFLQAFFKETM